MAHGASYTHQARLKLSRKAKMARRRIKRDKHAGIKEAQEKSAARRERYKVLQTVPRSERRRLRRKYGKAKAAALVRAAQ